MAGSDAQAEEIAELRSEVRNTQAMMAAMIHRLDEDLRERRAERTQSAGSAQPAPAAPTGQSSP
eukprot:13753822-Alexandrium_andersonii.AAC.1